MRGKHSALACISVTPLRTVWRRTIAQDVGCVLFEPHYVRGVERGMQAGPVVKGEMFEQGLSGHWPKIKSIFHSQSERILKESTLTVSGPTTTKMKLKPI